METRRIKVRNGEGLTFSVVGRGPARSATSMTARRKNVDRDDRASARERRQGVRLVASLRQRARGSPDGRGPEARQRDEILVSTKIGRIMDPFTKTPKPRSDVVSPGFAGGHPHAPRFDYSYDGAMVDRAFLASHGLDRLDIVLIHDCDVWTHGKEEAPARFKEAMEGAYRALDKLRNEKVIKAISFGINEADTCVKFAKAGDFDVAMMAGRYTLIDQTGLAEFLPLALEKNMGVMLAGVFNSGILATGSGAGAKYDYGEAPEAVIKKVKAIEEICTKHKVTLRQAAIQFALGHPAVVSVVLGAVKPEEVKSNVHDASVRSRRACGRTSKRRSSWTRPRRRRDRRGGNASRGVRQRAATGVRIGSIMPDTIVNSAQARACPGGLRARETQARAEAEKRLTRKSRWDH